MSLGIRASRELRQETRLSDARLTDEQDCVRAALIEFGQGSIERTQLLGAPDEVVGMQGHFLIPWRISQGRRTAKIRVRDQGAPLMSARPGSAKLGP